MEIVGMVADSVYFSVREENRPAVYIPFEARTGGTLLVRTEGAWLDLQRVIRREIPRLVPGMQVQALAPFDAIVMQQMVRERLLAVLSAFFATLALVLAIIGTYSVLNYAVTRERRETIRTRCHRAHHPARGHGRLGNRGASGHSAAGDASGPHRSGADAEERDLTRLRQASAPGRPTVTRVPVEWIGQRDDVHLRPERLEVRNFVAGSWPARGPIAGTRRGGARCDARRPSAIADDGSAEFVGGRARSPGLTVEL